MNRRRAAALVMAWVAVSAALLGTVGGIAGGVASAQPGLALRVRGNALVDATGAVMQLRGVNRSGAEYACVQGWGIFDGPSDDASVRAIAAWHANAVRIPLNEDCWLGINGVPAAYSGPAYRQAISRYVALLHAHRLYAVLDLHWSAPGSQRATGQQPMPDASHSPAFWRSVAGAFKADPATAFDLFNEPFPDDNTDSVRAWSCWRNGGSCAGVPFPAAGMQSLVSAVRGTGARNVVLVGGVTYANSLSRWLTYRPRDPAGQLVAAAHVYGNNACGAQGGGSCLTRTIAPVAAHVPVVLGEVGETYDDSECSDRNIRVILPWADARRISYLAWTWNTWSSCLSLIADANGRVNTSSPAGAAYATYVHRHLIERPSP
jgi:endoglucanase